MTSETNEELAIMAAQGDKESLHKLYFAVAPLLYKLISRYFPLCNKRFMEPEDLLQCGYFALLEAVKGFKPESGFLFNSYLGFPVQNICHSELGFRGKKQVETVSIETPLAGGDESFTIGDTIEDPDADIYSYCELSNMQLIVRTEIDKLPPRERIYIYYRYYENKTISEIAQKMGWPRGVAWNVRCSVFALLRKSEVMQGLGKAFNLPHYTTYINPEALILSFGDSGLEML